MKNQKHTPGPWKISETVGLKIVAPSQCGIKDGEYPIATWETAKETELEDLANARLIAAAPELLETAELVIRRWERGDLAEAIRLLSVAVRIAKGEL